MSGEYLISRYEHNFRGWLVSTKRRGRRFAKYFSDRKKGRTAALRAARAYRDKLISELPLPTKIKSKYVLNKTGVIGVALVKERTRTGRLMSRYVASWPTQTGQRGKATFSVSLYGKAEAFGLAVSARNDGLIKLGLK